jgi:transcriptional regulator with XRE-family HTH domain
MLVADDAKIRRRRRIGANIRLARQLAGLSQERLAVRLEIKRTHISEWETAVHEPGPASMEALSEALGQPEWWFFADHEGETC